MCVAIPGKVISVNESTAEVDFNGNRVNALAGLVKIKPGDYVLVHAGCVLQVMDEKEATDLIDLMKEVNNEY